MRTELRSWRIPILFRRLGTLVVLMLAGLLGLAAPALAATPTVQTDGRPLTVHSGPGTKYGPIAWMDNGSSVQIICQTHGSSIDGGSIPGNWGSTDIWDQIPGGGYVTDGFVYTGSNDMVAPPCGGNSTSDQAIPKQGDSPTLTDPPNCQPGDTENGCKSEGLPPRAPDWCPTDRTSPICNDDTGAFQTDVSNDYNTAQADGLKELITVPTTGLDTASWNSAQALRLSMKELSWHNAGDFFQRYLDNTGADLWFKSTDAYHDSPKFALTVDGKVRDQIQSGRSSFDSGYLGYDFTDSSDWAFAVGHGFYRVVDARRSDGSWSVHLQLTSYYQFRVDKVYSHDFTTGGRKVTVAMRGADLRRLEQIGWAKNYREVGTGWLSYNASGSLYPAEASG